MAIQVFTTVSCGQSDVPEELDTVCTHGTMRCAGGVFYIPNLYSLIPMSTWPGTEGKPTVPTRSKATLGEIER